MRRRCRGNWSRTRWSCVDRQLMYIRMNPRSFTPFGLGPLEVAFETVNQFLSAHRFAGKLGSELGSAVRIVVMTGRTPIHVDYARGTVEMVEQHDGTTLALRKLDAEYNVHDRLAAMSFIQHHAAQGQIVTGLLYVEEETADLHDHLNTVKAPLNALGEQDLCPGSPALDKINASLR